MTVLTQVVIQVLHADDVIRRRIMAGGDFSGGSDPERCYDFRRVDLGAGGGPELYVPDTFGADMNHIRRETLTRWFEGLWVDGGGWAYGTGVLTAFTESEDPLVTLVVDGVVTGRLAGLVVGELAHPALTHA